MRHHDLKKDVLGKFKNESLTKLVLLTHDSFMNTQMLIIMRLGSSCFLSYILPNLKITGFTPYC